MRSPKKETLHLPILVEQDEDNFYIVSCPTFKACHSYGKTIEEVIKMGIEKEEKDKSNTKKNRFIGFRELQMPLRTAMM